MPIPKNEDEMVGHGWKKELTIKHIVIRQGTIMCEEWDFFAEHHPCSHREGGATGHKCGIDHVWLTCLNGKLFWCCWKHRIANGPISFDVGNKANDYIVPASEAIEICKETGQEIPKELMEMWLNEKSISSGTRRRPKNK